MKRKILIVIYVLVILVMLKLLYNTVLNNILINKYNNGEFSTSMGQALVNFNFPQRYVANYNYGNIFYKIEEYEQAIEQYKKALEVNNIPEKKECKIRINYALAMCKTIELDENDEESIKNAIEVYESAIDILTEKGCANKDNNNGHSQDAEKLKQDIQKEIERLKKVLQSKSNKDNEQEDDKDEQKDEESDEDENEEKQKEEEIQKIKEDAIKEQRQEESKYRKYNKIMVNKNNKNW